MLIQLSSTTIGVAFVTGSLLASPSSAARAQRDSLHTRFSIEGGPAVREVRDYGAPARRWGVSARIDWETRQTDRITTLGGLEMTHFAAVPISPVLLIDTVAVPPASRDLRPGTATRDDWTPATAITTSLLAIGAYAAVRGYLYPHATGPFAEGGVGILRMTSRDQLDVRPAFTAAIGYRRRVARSAELTVCSRFEFLGFATNTATLGAARSPRSITAPLDVGLSVPLGR